MANTYISRTQANGTSSQKFTVSCWIKRGGLTSTQAIWGSGSATNDGCDLAMTGTDELTFESWDGSNNPKIITTRKFRDPSAWLHIVLAVDTTQATDTNRVKIYVNGVQETAFGTANYPSQNYNLAVSTTNDVMKFGLGGQYATSYWDGSMSHVHFIDGLQYQASDFGETDSTSGIWIAKTAPSVTYGTNGAFLKFENSGAMGTDSSGNSNTFAVGGGTLTQTIDTPDNNFCTNNRLDNYFFEGTYTNANLTVASSSATGKYSYGTTTFGIPDGVKIYCEVKMVSVTGGSIQARTGLTSYPSTSATLGVGSTTYTYGYSVDSGNIVTGNAGSSYGNSFALGDILGIAVDTVNNKLYFSKNGTWQNSGVPTSGSTGTGAVSIADLGTQSSTNSGHYFLSWSDESNTNGATLSWNFGQGYFGTTQVASAGTAPSEGGIFEYDCPSGYQALCTKGINSF